jgi:holo-[acyl-carrier protein] synthase
MSIIGVGTDVCRIARVESLMGQFGPKFLLRVLTAEEFDENISMKALARRWAVKEAVAKALGTGIGGRVGFQDIIVSHGAAGQPMCRVKGFDDVQFWVSASDDGDYATGFAVAEKV